jgi:hypothetical protein
MDSSCYELRANSRLEVKMSISREIHLTGGWVVCLELKMTSKTKVMDFRRFPCIRQGYRCDWLGSRTFWRTVSRDADSQLTRELFLHVPEVHIYLALPGKSIFWSSWTPSERPKTRFFAISHSLDFFGLVEEFEKWIMIRALKMMRLLCRSSHCGSEWCGITIAHTIRHRISSASLFKRLSIEHFDKYYYRRLLRWTGHVARMPLTRAPRKNLD